MADSEKPLQIEALDALTYISERIHFIRYYGMKYIAHISYNHTGQTTVESSN